MNTSDYNTPGRETITLQCARQGSKLRIRFHSYTDAEGKTFGNVYDNTYNCQFPRDIRQEGRFYEIGKDDLTLAVTGSTPFYRINKRNIRIVNRDGRTAVPVETKKAVKGKKKVESLPQPQLAVVPDQIFEVNECVICMSCVPNIIFLPCAHLCSCGDCFKMMQSKGNDCPMCRRRITGTIPKP